MLKTIYRKARSAKRRLIGQVNRTSLPAQIRKTDVFLVGFPRSGASWLSFILAGLANPGKKITLANFRDYVPDINNYYLGGNLGDFGRILGKNLKPPRIIFVHALFNPIFPKVIYIMRDPRDSLVSLWHFQNKLHPRLKVPLDEFVLRKRFWPASWDRFVTSWFIENRHPKLFLVKYEELHIKPVSTLKKLAAFLERNWSGKEIKRGVLASKFRQLQRLERKYGFVGMPEGKRFLRSGKIGTFRHELKPETLRALNQRYGRLLKKFGYAL